MRKLGTGILTAVLISSLVVTPLLAAPDIGALKDKKSAAQSEGKKLQKKLTEVIKKINSLEEELIATGEKIIQAEADLDVAQKTERKQYADMKIRIKYMYEEGNSSAVDAIMNASDFSDLLNKAEYVSSVHTYDRQKLKEYVETKNQIAALKVQLEDDEKELQKKQASFEKEEKNLDKLIEDNKDKIAALNIEIKEAEAQAAAEAAAEAARKKAEEEAKRRAEQEAQARAQTNVNAGGDDVQKTASANTDEGSEASAESSGGGGGGSYNASTTVSRAYSQLGKKYVYGAAGMNAFDCSGLVSYCLTGKNSHVYTSGSLAGCKRVSNPQPGDICVRSGHVGIYIGNGQMIHAPQTGDVVKIAKVPSNMWYVRP